MAMSIGLYEKEASKRNLLSAAKYFEIEEKKAEKIIDEVNSFVSENWKNYFKAAGIKDGIIFQFENAMKIK